MRRAYFTILYENATIERIYVYFVTNRKENKEEEETKHKNRHVFNYTTKSNIVANTTTKKNVRVRGKTLRIQQKKPFANCIPCI